MNWTISPVRRSGEMRSSRIDDASISLPLGSSFTSMSESEKGWMGSRGCPITSAGGSSSRRSSRGGAVRSKNSPWSTEAEGLGSWLAQSSSIWPSSGPRRGTSDRPRPTARTTGAPKVSPSSNGVNAIAQPSSALSSTGISTSIPWTRS